MGNFKIKDKRPESLPKGPLRDALYLEETVRREVMRDGTGSANSLNVKSNKVLEKITGGGLKIGTGKPVRGLFANLPYSSQGWRRMDFEDPAMRGPHRAGPLQMATYALAGLGISALLALVAPAGGLPYLIGISTSALLTFGSSFFASGSDGVGGDPLAAQLESAFAGFANPSFKAGENPFAFPTKDYVKLDRTLDVIIADLVRQGKKPDDIRIKVAATGPNDPHTIRLLLQKGITVVFQEAGSVLAQIIAKNSDLVDESYPGRLVLVDIFTNIAGVQTKRTVIGAEHFGDGKTDANLWIHPGQGRGGLLQNRGVAIAQNPMLVEDLADGGLLVVQTDVPKEYIEPYLGGGEYSSLLDNDATRADYLFPSMQLQDAAGSSRVAVLKKNAPSVGAVLQSQFETEFEQLPNDISTRLRYLHSALHSARWRLEQVTDPLLSDGERLGILHWLILRMDELTGYVTLAGFVWPEGSGQGLRELDVFNYVTEAVRAASKVEQRLVASGSYDRLAAEKMADALSLSARRSHLYYQLHRGDNDTISHILLRSEEASRRYEALGKREKAVEMRTFAAEIFKRFVSETGDPVSWAIKILTDEMKDYLIPQVEKLRGDPDKLSALLVFFKRLNDNRYKDAPSVNAGYFQMISKIFEDAGLTAGVERYAGLFEELQKLLKVIGIPMVDFGEM